MPKQDDEDLWEKVKNTITPLKERPLPHQLKSPRITRKLPKTEEIPWLVYPGPLQNFSEQKKSKRKPKNIHIEATLDLHGFTLEKAFLALGNFLRKHQTTQTVWVLIITGKGYKALASDRKTIREMFTSWINTEPLASIIGEYAHAQPHDGGQGAFYVRLKRRI